MLLSITVIGTHYSYNERHMPRNVEIISVSKGPIESNIHVTGTIVNDRIVTLAALIDGEINTIEVNVGDLVKAGQLLISFDNALSIHSVNRAKADLALQQSSLNAAERKLNRVKKLIHNLSVSTEELDTAKSSFEIEHARLNVLKENLSIEMLRHDNTRLYAPYSGVITEKFTGEGQWVESGTLLLKLASDKGREIEAQIDANDLSAIKLGDFAEVSTDSYSGLSWKERIIRISPSISSETSNTFPIRFTLSDDAPHLLLNQQVDIKVTISKKDNVFSVPFSALIDTDGKYQVILLVGDRAKYIPVSTGIESYTNIEIASGIDESLYDSNNTIKIIMPDNRDAIKDGELVNVLD